MLCTEQVGTGLPLFPVLGQGLGCCCQVSPSPAMPQVLSAVRTAAPHGSASVGPAPWYWLPWHPKILKLPTSCSQQV